MKYFNDIDLNGVSKLLNLPIAVNDSDAISKGQVVTIVNQLFAGFDFQKDVKSFQKDATLDPGVTPLAGDRYILSDVTKLHADFGTIAGASNGDIVEYDGSKFVVAYDVSVKGDGILVFCTTDEKYYKYVAGAWSYGGLDVITPGAALALKDGAMSVLFDDVTIGVDGNGKLYMKDKSVTKEKLGADIADTAKGMGQNSDGSLFVSVDGTTIDYDTNGKLKTVVPYVQKKAFDIGDGTAKEFTLNHVLKTTDVIVQGFFIASPKDNISFEVERIDIDNVKVIFDTVPATASVRVVVMG